VADCQLLGFRVVGSEAADAQAGGACTQMCTTAACVRLHARSTDRSAEQQRLREHQHRAEHCAASPLLCCCQRAQLGRTAVMHWHAVCAPVKPRQQGAALRGGHAQSDTGFN
jgi:hypothetical protein